MPSEEEIRNYSDFGGNGEWLQSVEDWIETQDDGKNWLSRLAADVGVPVQLRLPFEEKD